MIIKKGHHRAAGWIWRLRPHLGIRERSWVVTFDESCHYDSSNMDHWNKLTGWCNWNGKNSIRIGWRPALDGSKRVQLGAYIKFKGKRMTFMPGMDLGIWPYNLLLLIKIAPVGRRSGLITVEGFGFSERWMVVYNCYYKFGWLMHPYFGGVPKAPHDMKIDLQRL